MKTVQTPLDPLALRADFPILSSELREGVPLVYLDNAASSQRPRQVIERLKEVDERFYANVHRGIHWLSETATDLYEESRDTVRAFLNAASPEEVIFTRGTTEAINLVACSWGGANVKEGDEILLTMMEHHSNIVPWQQLAQRTGAVVRFLPVTDDGRLDLEQLDQYLTERTKIVAVTAVSNVLGTINPLERIIGAAKQQGAVVVVDAAQGVPHEPIDVQTLSADFVAFSGHKMCGPSGIGCLWGREELLETMPPFQGGGSMIHEVTLDGFVPAALPAKFEAGTPAIVPAIGLGTAVEFLQGVGLESIHQHEQVLVRRAHELLEPLEYVRIIGPDPEHKAGIVSFDLDGIHPHDAAQILDRRGFAVRAGHHCAMPLHKQLGLPASLRASFYLYNTIEEVEGLVEAIEHARRVFHDRPKKRRGEAS